MIYQHSFYCILLVFLKLFLYLYDNINDFMERFEKKEAIKKEKRKIAKEGLIHFYEEETDEQRSTVSN